MLDVLEQWVEQGLAPDRIEVQYSGYAPDEAPVRTRPVCAWPARAVYAGRGDIDVADSFVCRDDSRHANRTDKAADATAR